MMPSPAGLMSSANVAPCGSSVCTTRRSLRPFGFVEETLVAWIQPADVRTASADGPPGPAPGADESTGPSSDAKVSPNGAFATSTRSEPLRSVSAGAAVVARRTRRAAEPARIIHETLPAEHGVCRCRAEWCHGTTEDRALTCDSPAR